MLLSKWNFKSGTNFDFNLIPILNLISFFLSISKSIISDVVFSPDEKILMWILASLISLERLTSVIEMIELSMTISFKNTLLKIFFIWLDKRVERLYGLIEFILISISFLLLYFHTLQLHH